MVQLRSWPANVVPRHNGEITQAVELLCRRVHWNDANRRRLEKLLEPWFTAGWHVEAVLYALDYRPDGTSQPRRGSRETADEFVKARLAYWYDESPAAGSALAKQVPPKPGLELDQFLTIARERRRREQRRPAAALSEQGQRARQLAWERSRRREDPVRRRRAEDDRVQAALESLLPPDIKGQADPVAAPEPSRAAPSEIADLAGRRCLIRNNPRVVRCVREIAESGGTPTREQVRVLRGAILEARQNARLVSLETATAAAAPALSADARRMTEILANVTDWDMPVEAVVTLLEQADWSSSGSPDGR